MSADKRRGGDRRRSFARILLSIEGRVGYVADLSDGGIRGLFPETFDVGNGQEFRLDVAFEELHIDPFSLDVIARWSRIEEGALLVGFELVDPCAETDTVRYGILRRYYMEASGNNVDPPPGGC